MKITLVQYGGMSRNGTLSGPCGKVHMTLQLKKLPYEVLNVRTPGQAKRFNPRGRVPSLLFDDEAFVDSTDILTELDRRFPDPPLDPRNKQDRARAKILEDWADEVIYFYLVWLRWCHPPNFQAMRERIRKNMPAPFRWIVPVYARRVARNRLIAQGTGVKDEATIRRELSGCLDAVVEMLGRGEYLVGDRISRADIACAAMLDQLAVDKFTPRAAADLAKRPEIGAWLERVHQVAPSAAI